MATKALSFSTKFSKYFSLLGAYMKYFDVLFSPHDFLDTALFATVAEIPFTKCIIP